MSENLLWLIKLRIWKFLQFWLLAGIKTIPIFLLLVREGRKKIELWSLILFAVLMYRSLRIRLTEYRKKTNEKFRHLGTFGLNQNKFVKSLSLQLRPVLQIKFMKNAFVEHFKAREFSFCSKIKYFQRYYSHIAFCLSSYMLDLEIFSELNLYKMLFLRPLGKGFAAKYCFLAFNLCFPPWNCWQRLCAGDLRPRSFILLSILFQRTLRITVSC